MARVWSRDEEQLVKQLYHEGNSFGDIAVALSNVTQEPMSRNQIAGICRRLGLRREQAALTRSGLKSERVEQSHASLARRIKQAAKKRSAVQKIRSSMPKPAGDRMSLAQMVGVPAPESIGVPLTELGEGQCTFLVQTGDGPELHCGAPVFRSSKYNPHRRRYCQAHLQRIYSNVPAIKKGDEAHA